MTTRLTVGLDVGTGSVKAVAVNDRGAICAEARSDPIRTHHPVAGAAEQDPEEVIEAVRSTLTRLRGELGGSALGAVGAMAIAAQSGSVTPIGRDRRLRPMITWMDTRAAPLIAQLPGPTVARIRELTGWSPSAGLGLATIAWMRSEDPDRFDEIDRFASADDLVVHQLLGAFVTTPTNASGMQLMDLGTRTWSAELCELAGIGLDQLSAIAPTGSLLGQTDAFGGPPVAVIAGGHDQTCSALALGLDEIGASFVSVGTAWVITVALDADRDPRRWIRDLPASFNLSPSWRSDRWLASAGLGGLGGVLDWWCRRIGRSPQAMMDDLREHRPEHHDPLFILGSPDEQHGWGRFIGDLAPLDGVERDRIRSWAVLEATAFAVRRALDELDEASTGAANLTAPATIIERPPLSIVGGAAHLATARVIAAATNRRVRCRHAHSWPALGAAQLAANPGTVHPGQSNDPADPAHHDLDETAAVDVWPDPELSDRLRARYDRFLRAEASPPPTEKDRS